VAYYTSLFGAFIPANSPHWLFWAAVVIVVAALLLVALGLMLLLD
jgi:hypothetical protein